MAQSYTHSNGWYQTKFQSIITTTHTVSRIGEIKLPQWILQSSETRHFCRQRQRAQISYLKRAHHRRIVLGDVGEHLFDLLLHAILYRIAAIVELILVDCLQSFARVAIATDRAIHRRCDATSIARSKRTFVEHRSGLGQRYTKEIKAVHIVGELNKATTSLLTWEVADWQQQVESAEIKANKREEILCCFCTAFHCTAKKSSRE